MWDYQLNYSMAVRQSLALVSAKNLVANIGFGAEAVHTIDPADSRVDLPVFAAPTDPRFPQKVLPDKDFERQIIRRLYFNKDLTVLGTVKGILRSVLNGRNPGRKLLPRGSGR